MHGAAPFLTPGRDVSVPAWNIVFQGEKSMTNMAISVLKEKKAEIEKEIQDKKLLINNLEKGLGEIEGALLNLVEENSKIITDSNSPLSSSKVISQVLKEENNPMDLTEITRRVVEDKNLELKRNAVGAALHRLVKKGLVKRYETKPTTWSIP
ncbi:MAG: hypothetical protein F4039_06145 [Gammaproteobacteria bacterium]|nr:hypothetical protein [Gammaproteobacteria bacterium]